MKTFAVINEFSVEAIKDALQKLNAFENLTVNGLNSNQLNEIKNIDSELFEKVKEHILSGRWYPSVGMWTNENEKISEARLIKNIIYSVRFFDDNFGKFFKCFNTKTIYNDSFSQIVYNSRCDAVVVDDESDDYWLDTVNGFRTYIIGGKNAVDVNDIDDEFIKATEKFYTFGEIMEEAFVTPMEFDIRTLGNNLCFATEEEKLLIDAEKISAQNNENKTAEIKSAWLALFNGDKNESESIAKRVIAGRKFDECFIRISDSDVVLAEYKFTEDGSGDKIIRLKETSGKTKSITVMCNAIDAGFCCEVDPFEIQTFRVDKDGFVKEIFIGE